MQVVVTMKFEMELQIFLVIKQYTQVYMRSLQVTNVEISTLFLRDRDPKQDYASIIGGVVIYHHANVSLICLLLFYIF